MTTTNDIFSFLHGRRYKLDGLSGTFRHEVTEAIYPYRHTVERLIHEPTKAARRTESYRQMKQYLGDDWSTDLTDSIERYCRIAQQLGYE